jgi:hypothetical protein
MTRFRRPCSKAGQSALGLSSAMTEFRQHPPRQTKRKTCGWSMISPRSNSCVSRQLRPRPFVPSASNISLSSSPRTGKPPFLHESCLIGPRSSEHLTAVFDAPLGSVLHVLTLPGQIRTVITCLTVHVRLHCRADKDTRDWPLVVMDSS